MTALLKILELILVMGVLILVHEAGHFAFAKIFGIRVDKFYLFFDFGDRKLLSTRSGWFSRLFPKAKEWDTEYGIGWCPLGGYCKIAGMIDESMDTEHLKTEPQPFKAGMAETFCYVRRCSLQFSSCHCGLCRNPGRMG